MVTPYRISKKNENQYETKDKKFLALGALEDKFWYKFCNIIGAPSEVKLEKLPNKLIVNKVKKIIKNKNEDYWKKKFDKEDNACCNFIEDVNYFINDKHLVEKKIFDNKILINNKKVPAIPTSLDRKLNKIPKISKAPKLGQHNNLLRKK